MLRVCELTHIWQWHLVGRYVASTVVPPTVLYEEPGYVGLSCCPLSLYCHTSRGRSVRGEEGKRAIYG